jgi:hypothetical protein
VQTSPRRVVGLPAVLSAVAPAKAEGLAKAEASAKAGLMVVLCVMSQ